MSTTSTLQLALASPIHLLDAMTRDMSSEQLHWNPPGTAHSVAATLAHAAMSTDWQIHQLFEGGTPMFETDWADKTGVSQPQFAQTLEWAQSVRVDMPVFQVYAREVYARLRAYVDGLSEADFARPVDMSIIGRGDQSLEWCIATVVVGHLNQLAGEIAAVKGAQGLQGYTYS